MVTKRAFETLHLSVSEKNSVIIDLFLIKAGFYVQFIVYYNMVYWVNYYHFRGVFV